MMTNLLVRLAILLPMIGGLAWASLWLWRKVQAGLPTPNRAERIVRMVEVLPLGTAGRLAVIEFGGRHMLIAISRSGISLVADHG
jgi:flagellar protein FliO/FliZ